MLDGGDSVHWDDPAVACWLDRLTDADEEDEDEIRDEVPASLLRDGALGPDAATAVPFLLRLAALNPDYRGFLAGLVERLVSPDFDTPGMSEQVRAAVAEELEPVIGWADDGDVTMRMYAYLILGQCQGPADLLRRRWEVEVDGYARLALLLALGACDPDAVDAVLRPALQVGAPSERLAAALALYRTGLPLPAGSGRLVGEAVRAGATLSELYSRDPLDELLDGSRDEEFVTGFRAAATAPDTHDGGPAGLSGQ